MSSNASGTPNRSARARALGRSMSQIACTSTFLSFRRVGRWATCAIAPPPTIPTRRRSLVLRLAVMRCPPSVEPLEGRPWVVGGKNALVVLPRTGAAHRPPLAEADAVPSAGSVRREPRDAAAIARDGEGECVAPERIARHRPQHLANVRAVHQDVAAPETHRELPDATRMCAVRHAHVAHLAHIARD